MSRSPVAFGSYVITRRIARGGMAEIFRARSRGDARWVALKMMRPSLGHEDLREQLFKREARIASAIDHPNVVRLIEFGKESERYFLAMEYVRGRDLTALIGTEEGAREALSFEVALFVGLEAARGLGHAHRLRDPQGQPLQIVHRDISPGNVMVGWDGSVRLLDFGVARMNESHGMRTQTGTLRGKFAYMSPEQTLGLGVDARSDVFALGTLLYEMLTGANPFRARTPLKTIERVQRVRPAPPSRVDRRVPKEVDELLARCLAKDPGRRFDDAQAFHDALADFLGRQSFGDAKEKLAGVVGERFAWERSEEERELREEEDEVALIEVVDFSLTGSEGLDASRIVVSEEQEASQQEIRSHALDQPGQERDEPVFDARETARVAVPAAPMGVESSATAPSRPEVTDRGPPPREDPVAFRGVAPSFPPASPALPAAEVARELARHEAEGRFEPAAPQDLRSSGPVPLDLAATAAMLPPNEVGIALASAAVLGRAALGPAQDKAPSFPLETAVAESTGNTKIADPMLLAIVASGPKAVTSVPFDSAPRRSASSLLFGALGFLAIAGGAYAMMGIDNDAIDPSVPRVASVVREDRDVGATTSDPLPTADAALPVDARVSFDGGLAMDARGGSDARLPDVRPDVGVAPPRPDAGFAPRIEERSKRRPPPPPRKLANGALNVAATPWASIEIDGKDWPYQTPQAGIELSPGRHTIRLVNRETGKSKSISVIIKSGQTKTISADLSRP
ncbi:MAG: serine/threonine protein kinase [Deltaproteobacteria bacterium]|nr:serine/threonine protein kinase [Deltaproteobacteria bacterium]